MTVNEAYAVQIWVNDPRSAGVGRYETVSNTVASASTAQLLYNSLSAVGSAGQYVIGTFVADATTNRFTLLPSASGSVQLSAISVRDLGGANKIWLGSSSTSWGTGGNWSPSGVPIGGQSVVFNTLSTANLSTVPDQSYTLGSLSLSNAPSAVSINSGSSLTLNVLSGINFVGTAQSLTIADPLALGASQTWNVAGSASTLALNGGVSGTAAVTLTGSGTASLGSAATYTGNTTISGGRFLVGSGGSLASLNISVGSGGTLALSGSGTLAATNFSFAGGSTFNVSAAASTFTLGSGILASTSSNVVINGTSDCSSGTISMTYDGVNPCFIQTNGTLTLSAGNTININIPGAVLQAGTYTLIAAATTGNIGSVTGSLPTPIITGNAGVGVASLVTDGSGNLNLVIATPAVWTGAVNNLWSNGGNWIPGNEPNPADSILFNNLSTANLNVSQDDIGAGGVVFGLSVINPSGAVTISGPGSLTTYGGGLNLSSASRNLTIASPLVINATQNWLLTNSRTLTISGAVSSVSGGNVTVSGGGTLLMGAAHVLDALTNNAATCDLTVNGSKLELNGNAQAMNGLSGDTNAVVDNSSATPITLALGGNGDTSAFNGTVQNTGGGALTLDALAGRLTLNSSSNTYSGGTIVESGAFIYFPAATAKYGTGPVTIKAGGNTYAGNSTFTNVLSLDSCYLRVGGGNLNVQNWSGPITLANGLQMSGDSGAGGVTLSGPINFGSSGTSITNTGGNGPNEGFNVSLTGDLLSGVISGSGGITYYCDGGNSRLTVQGANTYSGGTVVNGTSNGKLNVYNSVNPFSTGAVTLNAGAIIEAAPGSGTVTNALTLNGGILESEAQFNNYNTLTWSGPITLTADSSFVQFATGALNNNQSSGVNVSGPLNINGFTLTCSSQVACFGGNTISGSISGAGNINQNGLNALTLSGSNTFSGTIRSMTFANVSGNNLGNLSLNNAYAVQNATLDMNAADTGLVTLNNLNHVIGALTGTRDLNLGSGAVSIGNNNSTTVYTGSLSGSGTLTKIGSGTLSVSNNALTGSVTVSSGTLVVAQPTFANSAVTAVTVGGGAFLQLDFDATNVVANLVLNGVGQTGGIYKAANSGGRITGIGAIQVVPPTAWIGAVSTSWNTGGNWANGNIPGGGSNAVFNAVSTANLATVLNASFNIGTLQLLNPTGPVSIAPGGANTLTLTNGIDMSKATQPLTITAPVVLGADQVWLVASNRTLSVSNLSGTATLALTGGGTVVLNGTNTSTGNRVIQNGTIVRFAGAGTNAFQTSGTIYVTNSTGTGTIDLNGTTQTSPSYVSFPFSSTTTLTNGTLICNAAATTAVNANEDYNYMGTINVAPNANFISNRRFIVGFNFNNQTATINSLNNTTNGSLTWGGDNSSAMNYIGINAKVNSLRINGSTVNFNNASTGTGNGYMNIGANNASSSGAIFINGGNMNVGTWMKLVGVFNTLVGITCTGTLNVTNGVVTVGGGSDTINNGVLFMDGANGDNTVNTGVSTLSLANGATLNVAQIQAGNGGTKTINFNGGTLGARPGATNNFLSAATGLTANIQDGGATINSGANSIVVGAALVANGTGGLTKTGVGTLTLTNANTYSGGTIISAGTLLVNNPAGSGAGTGAVNVNGGTTLGGTGSISGLVTNNSGGILMPGVSNIGKLTLNGNAVLLAGSTNTFVVNGTTAVASNSVAVGAAITYGGVLNILTNGTFTVGQTFQLFSGAGATNTGNFASIAGNPGAGNLFTFTNGVLSVVSAVVGPSGPARLTNSISGNTLSLSWPAGQGWRLQVQTNNLLVGLRTNWVYLTDGTASSTNLTVDSAKPTVFYRLTYP